MLVDSTDQIIGDADIQRAAVSARKNVNPVAHFSMMDCRVKPGNDVVLLPSRQFAALKPLHRDGIDIDAVEAAHVDRPLLRRGTRAAEWEDAAGLGKIVARGVGVEGV